MGQNYTRLTDFVLVDVPTLNTKEKRRVRLDLIKDVELFHLEFILFGTLNSISNNTKTIIKQLILTLAAFVLFIEIDNLA